MTTDALAAVALEATSATTITTYEYGDPAWPDRPTAVRRPSVVAPGATREEHTTFHPVAGTPLVRSVTGYAGQEAARKQRGTTTVLYELRNGDDGPSGLEPAFDPGGSFQTAWLTLPQPNLAVRSVDGPRSAVADVTSYVYYPVDQSVPSLLRGRLAATQNASGHVTRYESYDVFGNPTRVTDPNGVATEMTYDALGRLRTTTIKGVTGCDGAGDPWCATDLTMTRTYASGVGPLASEENPGGGTTVFAYDARGRVRTISRGPSSTDLREQVETSYDPLTGRKSLERSLAFENSTWVEKRRETYAYNALAELTTITHADGTTAAYTYDAAGRLETVRDENHAAPNTSYAYDPAGRLKTVRQVLAGAPTGEIATRHAYDLHGNLTSVTDPNGNVTSYTYDDFGLLVRQVSPVTGTTTYDYDAAGNLVASTDARGARVGRSYDAIGRLTRADATHAGTSEPVIYEYDAAGAFAIGRLARMVDPAGATEYRYDRRGLVLQERRTFSNQPPTVPPAMDDGRDDGTSVPGGGGGGDCGDGRDCGRTAGTMDDGREGDGTIVITPSHVATTTYRYDRDGLRSSIAYPSGTLTVAYTHDYAGRPLTASGFVTNASYLPFGPTRELRFANGTTQKLEYDNRYRITKNEVTIDGAPGSTALARYTYSHDGAGNITGIHDTLAPEYHRHFAYDDLNRLTVANTGPNATPDRPQRSTLWGKGSYTWDAMGNLRSLKLGEIEPNTDPEPLRRPPKPPTMEANVPQGRSSSFTYDGPTPRLTGVATNDVLRSVTHDAVGNETSYFATRTYSPRNVLSTVTDTANSEDPTNVHAIAYVADGRGIRAIRAESPSNGVGTTARRYFTYSPELHLLSVTRDDSTNVWEPDAYPQPGLANNVFQEIVWFGDRPVGQVNPGLFTRYTVADHLGTPFMQTDAARAVVWRVEYEPFGNVYAVRTGNRTEQPLRFPGQELASTWEGPEENYNIFRWYRAGWGRYTQSDPLEPGGAGFFTDSGLLTFATQRVRAARRNSTELPPLPYARVESLYTYAAANPLNFIDPDGLRVVPCRGGGTGPIPDFIDDATGRPRRTRDGRLIGECKILLACADPPRIRIYTTTIRHVQPCPPCPGPTDCLAWVDTDTGQAVGRVACRPQ